ncbi:MAG: helix-turn-helix domain-containing protein [Nitrospiraceae bacterium]
MIQAWRLSRQQSTDALAQKASLLPSTIEAIESDEFDPPASVLEALASALAIPPSWLYGNPREFDLLLSDPEEGEPNAESNEVDPVIKRIIHGARQDRSLYTLVTALLQSGDPKLLRAAEVSLRSLVKQSKPATVPWQSRPPGHFEPPSD